MDSMAHSLRSRRLVSFFAAGALLAATGAVVADGPAERTERGLTLVVPGQAASKGTVYYVQPGRDAQATFTSDAPLEHIKGTSNRVIGYAVWSDERGEGGPMGLVAGEFVMAVESLDTGIPLRDEHLQGSNWLNAATYPDVTFRLVESRDVEVVRRTDEFTTYSMTLVGDMTIKGITSEVRTPARVTVMPESEATRTRAQGDLIAIRAGFNVSLSEHGVAHQTIGAKVAEDVEIDVALFLATVSPEAARRGR